MNNVYLFTADWCSGCKSLKPELKRIEGGLGYTEIDADSLEGGELIAKYGIRALPTLLKVNEAGEVREALTGYRYSREIFEKFFEVSA